VELANPWRLPLVFRSGQRCESHGDSAWRDAFFQQSASLRKLCEVELAATEVFRKAELSIDWT
jgi:hypothetical protein